MQNLRKVLHAKIHRATVTQADLDYEGSITLPADLMEAAHLHENEAVNIWNVTQGTRFETYTILGEDDSRDICINGAAAHLASPGDLIIIASFKYIEESKLLMHEPYLVFVDGENRISHYGPEVPGPRKRLG